MASWMVHLRIADKLLDTIPSLSSTEFIVGNIAPDSGVPNEDWSAFSPPTTISHFKDGAKKANPQAFAAKYFTAKQQISYSNQEYAFYLGYLTHLITDVLWSENIVATTLNRIGKTNAPDRKDYIWKAKEDWYDLDYKYLRDHPDFRAFRIYQGAVGFQNEFMDEFAFDAFDNRRIYITDFYLQENKNLDREYPYLTEAQMDAFVLEAVETILSVLYTKYIAKL